MCEKLLGQCDHEAVEISEGKKCDDQAHGL